MYDRPTGRYYDPYAQSRGYTSNDTLADIVRKRNLALGWTPSWEALQIDMEQDNQMEDGDDEGGEDMSEEGDEDPPASSQMRGRHSTIDVDVTPGTLRLKIIVWG